LLSNFFGLSLILIIVKFKYIISKGHLGGQLGALLQSRDASGVVQGRVRDGVPGQRSVQLDAQLELLDGRDAAELLGSVGVVLGPGPGPTRPRPPLGRRTAGQPSRRLSPPQSTQKRHRTRTFGQKLHQ